MKAIILTFVLSTVLLMDTFSQSDSIPYGVVEKKTYQLLSAKWFPAANFHYAPDPEVVREAAPLKNGISITLIMGFWCEDSQREVPHIFEVLKRMDWKGVPVKIISVDRDKKADTDGFSSLNIEYVPTFIVYRNGIEIGRIVETPKASLEKDILSILKTP